MRHNGKARARTHNLGPNWRGDRKQETKCVNAKRRQCQLKQKVSRAVLPARPNPRCAADT